MEMDRVILRIVVLMLVEWKQMTVVEDWEMAVCWIDERIWCLVVCDN